MKNIIYLIIIIFITSCNKEDNNILKLNDNTEVPPYKKFLGTYQVENLNTGEQYQMKIGYKNDTLENGNVFDYLDIYNFDNNFDYLIRFYKFVNAPNYIEFIWYFGIRDRNNNRWAIFQISDDTTTTIKENTLINDTIIFYFRKTNMAFWPSDGALFYECYCKHRAVKISNEY